MRCGLIGKKLGHSYSPQIHSHLGSYSYLLFEKQPEDLEHFLRNGEFDGINVTIPYKKAVIPYCHTLTDTATKLGAVNTIVRNPDGTLTGHNTDYFGFTFMLRKSGLQVSGKKVLVLGSGGASATAVQVLKEHGANVVVISRTGPNNYSNLGLHADAAAIVNATPVGMYPDVGVSPVDISLFPNLEGVLDLVYNPARTAILMAAEERKIVALNGLWMLVAQAKEAAQWFTGQSYDDKIIDQIHATLQLQMQNIILVGMPGSGKSTIGKLLAEKLSRIFVDADEMIVKHSGMSIPEIFENMGESGFRKIESQVLADLGRQSGLVIATGGGCVTVEDNYRHLHQNGVIIWIKRNINDLPTDGRPLSMRNNIEEMYLRRKPMYARFSDFCVNNVKSASDATTEIYNLVKGSIL